MLFAKLVEHINVARSACAKVEVAADNHSLGLQAIDDNTLDELLRSFRGPDLVERHDNNRIDTALIEQLQLEVEFGEQARRILRPKHHRRVRLKGDNGGLRIETRGDLLRRSDDGLVPAMDAVVHPDGQGMALF